MAVPDQILRTATLSTDLTALYFVGTGADRNRAVLKRALEVLEHNKMITFTEPDTWPEWISLDPVIEETTE